MTGLSPSRWRGATWRVAGRHSTSGGNGRRLRARNAVVVAAAGLVALAGCGSGGANPAGKAGGSKAVVGTWGGDYQNFLKQFVEPALEKSDSAPKVVYDTGDPVPRMTKMRSQAGKDGSLDVTLLGDTDMEQMAEAGLLDKIDTSKLPNFSHVRESLTNPYWIPHIYSANVIIYNTKKVTPAPDSYDVFWDSKYSGKIGVLATQWSNFYFAAAAVVKNGKPGTDIDAGWDKLKQLAGHVKVYGSQEQLGQALESGEVWMTANWKARAYQWNKAGGEPLSSVVPKEGTFPVVFAAGIPKNTPNKDAAYAFLNAMLDPKAQVDFGQNMGYTPTVDNATLPGDLDSQLGFTADEQKLIYPVDYAYIAKNDPRWHQQWQQQIVNGG